MLYKYIYVYIYECDELTHWRIWLRQHSQSRDATSGRLLPVLNGCSYCARAMTSQLRSGGEYVLQLQSSFCPDRNTYISRAGSQLAIIPCLYVIQFYYPSIGTDVQLQLQVKTTHATQTTTIPPNPRCKYISYITRQSSSHNK